MLDYAAVTGAVTSESPRLDTVQEFIIAFDVLSF